MQNRALAHLVAHKFRLEWSPEQIAGWLKRAHPDDEAFQVSHETIYRSLFIQARGALKKELIEVGDALQTAKQTASEPSWLGRGRQTRRSLTGIAASPLLREQALLPPIVGYK